MEIKEGKTYLTVPHKGGKLTFQYPAFMGYAQDVANEIDEKGLRRPNSPETASLVYDAFQNSKGKYESEIVNILENYWFREFTGNLYLPESNEEINNGVIIDNSPKLEDGKIFVINYKNNLIKKLHENDPNVKFVPFGFKTGGQSLIELKKNPYIIARYGEEGAEKIAEVASKYKLNPNLQSFIHPINKEEIRLSALYSYFGDSSLKIDGINWNIDRLGHSFGIVDEKK